MSAMGGGAINIAEILEGSIPPNSNSLEVENDFSLIINNQTHLVSTRDLVMCSRTILNLLMENSLCRSFEINTGHDGDHLIIIILIQGQGISIPRSQNEFVLDVAIQLQMHDVVGTIISKGCKHFPFDQIIPIYIKLFNNGLPSQPIVDHIAKNFEELQPYMNELTEDQLDFILKSDYLSASPELISSWVHRYVDPEKNPNHRLVKHLPPYEITALKNLDFNRLRFLFVNHLLDFVSK